MKNKIILLTVLSLVVALCLCGCNLAGKEGSSSDISNVSSVTSVNETDTAKEMHSLFDENLNCMLNIFELSFLPCEETPFKDTFLKVTDERFKTFADLETYVRNVYVKETAEELLFRERFDGHKLYNNIDGVFAIDQTVMGGKGYYVNWKDYELKIDSLTENECKFTVTATLEEPAEVTEKVPYQKEAVAVKQDGKWLLKNFVT